MPRLHVSKEQLKPAALDLSVAGMVGAYLAALPYYPALAHVPLWAVLAVAVAGALGRGLYRAWKDDGRISREEAAALFGLGINEVEAAIHLARQHGMISEAGAPKALDEIDNTPVVDLPIHLRGDD